MFITLVLTVLPFFGYISMQTYREKLGGGRSKSVTNDVTETNHIWLPFAMEKDQDSKTRAALMGIIIYGKWDSFRGSETEKSLDFTGQ